MSTTFNERLNGFRKEHFKDFDDDLQEKKLRVLTAFKLEETSTNNADNFLQNLNKQKRVKKE